MKPTLADRIEDVHRSLVAALLAELGPGGHWVGELSSSALSTATAVVALATMGNAADTSFVARGLQWLADQANADGGWGDTVRSKSNLSTTALAWAAFGAARADAQFRAVVDKAARYLEHAAGAGLSPDGLVAAVEERYGEDRTFSVPITMTLALAGRLGPKGWDLVRPLPFELAALPRALFGALRLPVVSYALPALIAIGQVIHHHAPRFNPARMATRRRTLRLLATLQPENGGFLEAIPLTSFVTMSLAGMNEKEHIVARRGAEFLRSSVRPDGSWPIDTNLCTWVTTLAIKALRHAPDALRPEQRTRLSEWLLGQQHRTIHAYTGAAPGGWAWCDLPGGVPDADDTAGALAALDLLRPDGSPVPAELANAAAAGVRWLLDLQNRDGGIPTFCRGWGKLPFDRSAPELTVHAIRAWLAWMPALTRHEATLAHRAMTRAIRYLVKNQTPDGMWIPLWFGNEHAPAEENPVYGTAQVLIGLETIEDPALADCRSRGYDFLRRSQNADGGWGGALGAPSTIEETAMAVEALGGEKAGGDEAMRGLEWLVSALRHGQWSPAPVGLYFARLWYFEKLYPLIFACGALGRWAGAKGLWNRPASPASADAS